MREVPVFHPKKLKIPEQWTFNSKEVAKDFDSHVREQLPWYELATNAIVHIARHYIPKHGTVYDIGASTGNIGQALKEILTEREVNLIGIEESQAMVDLYRKKNIPGQIIRTDAAAFDYQRFDLAVCYLVLMFVPIARRRGLIQTLRDRVKPGGAIIIFDKFESLSGYPATIMWRMALLGKVAAGANGDDVIRKELSLRGVQRPLSRDILGADAIEWFRFGEFSGFLIEAPGA